MSVSTAKQEVQRILDQLPDEASYEEIRYRIYVREKIQRGLEDLEAGRSFTDEEFSERMREWLVD
jgi:predicted transcriptional regulator